MNILLEVVGWGGAAAVVIAYGLAASGALPTDRPGSAWLNLLGAAGLMINSAASQAWPSTALNLLWLFIGLFSLARYRRSTTPPGAPATPGSQTVI
jgi:hypothetical protein